MVEKSYIWGKIITVRDRDEKKLEPLEYMDIQNELHFIVIAIVVCILYCFDH